MSGEFSPLEPLSPETPFGDGASLSLRGTHTKEDEDNGMYQSEATRRLNRDLDAAFRKQEANDMKVWVFVAAAWVAASSVVAIGLARWFRWLRD